MSKMMVPTYPHVPVLCFLLLHLLFCCVVFQGVGIPFWPIFNFPIFPAPAFSPFCSFSLQFCTCLSVFVFVTTMFQVFQGASVMVYVFPVVLRPPVFPFGFVLSIRGGGKLDLGAVFPNPSVTIVQRFARLH